MGTGTRKGSSWSQSPALKGGEWPLITSRCSMGAFFSCKKTPLFELAVGLGARTQRSPSSALRPPLSHRHTDRRHGPEAQEEASPEVAADIH